MLDSRRQLEDWPEETMVSIDPPPPQKPRRSDFLDHADRKNNRQFPTPDTRLQNKTSHSRTNRVKAFEANRPPPFVVSPPTLSSGLNRGGGNDERSNSEDRNFLKKKLEGLGDRVRSLTRKGGSSTIPPPLLSTSRYCTECKCK